jgi:transposase
MTRSYSLDLRVRVAGFVEAGHSCRAAARHFGVSDSFAIKLMQRRGQSGSPAPARQGRPRGTGKLAPYAAFLIQAVETKPDITMPDLAARLWDEHGVVAAPATLSRFLCRQGFTYKNVWPAPSASVSVIGLNSLHQRIRPIGKSALAQMEIRAP